MGISDELKPLYSPYKSSPVIDSASILEESSGERSREDYLGLPLEHIDSFLPFLELLPGLKLVDGVYFHHGAVSSTDVEKLSSYAREVGQFTLTDTVIGPTCSIHPGTVLRLQQLHYRFANGPLLPSLHLLRITGAKSSLDHLNVFLSPSLRSLEVADIEEYHQTPVCIFLDNLLEEAKDLSQITLGPGRVVGDILQASLKFKNLSQLELVDTIPAFNFDLLEQIGALPRLETFVLNARTSLYTERPSFPSHPLVVGLKEPSSNRPLAMSEMDGRSLASSEDSEEIEQPPVSGYGFRQLKKLHIFGSLALIQDLYTFVTSEEIQDLGLTLTRTQRLTITAARKKANKTMAGHATEVFVDVVQAAVAKWSQTLRSVLIGRERERSAIPISDAVLPTSTFESLLIGKFLEQLEINGLFLTGVFDHIDPTISSKLQVLHLPIDHHSSRISLSKLRSIGQAFPHLVSLRCNINDLSAVPKYPNRVPATDALSHGLQTLSIGSVAPISDPQRLLSIVRYFNILFPHLQKIETHEGYNEDQWKYIGDLIDLCHNARVDEVNRPSTVL